MLKRVISASRREEMVGFAPERLATFLRKRCPPEQVHTLVVWTKVPHNLLRHPLLRELNRMYDQIYIHLTVTGMGGTPFEPGIPKPELVLCVLPELIRWVGDPRRIAFRFDPIIHLVLPNGERFTNLPAFVPVIGRIHGMGIDRVIVSWMEAYPKVVRNLARYGLRIDPLDSDQWATEAAWLRREAEKRGISVWGCCVPGWPRGACIDGARLTMLHPLQEPADMERAKGQRSRCGCTRSWDIGWYYPCPGGCVYCYANPRIRMDSPHFPELIFDFPA